MRNIARDEPIRLQMRLPKKRRSKKIGGVLKFPIEEDGAVCRADT